MDINYLQIKKINFILITVIYSIIQLSLNYVLIYESEFIILLTYTTLILFYAITRIKLEGYNKLFINYN